MNKKKILFNVILAASMAFAIFVTNALCLELAAGEELKEATGCTFVLNPEFVPAGVKGYYVNKYRPMESSSVSYVVHNNSNDFMLTNREKAEQASGEKTIDSLAKLDKHKYETLVSAGYAAQYGGDVGFKVESFERIEIDGYPGYKIDAHYEPEGSQAVYQTVYIIRSKYRTFTITYQRAADDECEESFQISASTIRVH
ncbi:MULTISPECIES: hypothetical protein [unclassified Butyrivibrio]|uniref:hypothetical protein n=1 Tax=unclassified Butyrivibrio TaxID=2639466 RepID=UPI00047A9885|nr:MULTISPECIES: hypothetical protein [unclassified Butyrivibrio]